MSGLIVVQTTANVGTFVDAWKNFVSTARQYVSGDADSNELATAIASVVSAGAGLSESPQFATISKVTGFASGISSFQTDFKTLE